MSGESVRPQPRTIDFGPFVELGHLSDVTFLPVICFFQLDIKGSGSHMGEHR